MRQQVRQNLEAAGYTDVKVMPESFLVRAKDRSGNPVMMIINPGSVTAVTTLSSSTSGNSMSSGSGSSTGSTQALNLTTQQKQQITQLVASQPAEQAPANFQPSVGQKVPSSLTLKSFPSSAEGQLPASLQGDQYAKPRLGGPSRVGLENTAIADAPTNGGSAKNFSVKFEVRRAPLSSDFSLAPAFQKRRRVPSRLFF